MGTDCRSINPRVRLQGWICVTMVLSGLLPLAGRAAYLRDLPRVLTQPDGTTIDCFASGDEYFHRLHDAAGYTILQDATTGWYLYAERAGDRLVATSWVVGAADPASVGLEPGAGISEEEYRRRVAFRRAGRLDKTGQPHWMPNTGELNNIVIYIRFQDEAEFGEPISVYDAWFNDTTAGANSMTRYFSEVSYEQLAITTTFYPPAQGGMVLSYQDSHARGYYQPKSGTNPGGYTGDLAAMQREFQLLHDAVDAVGGEVPPGLDVDSNNDGYVDNVCFIVRGDPDDWSDLLWPHMWQLYEESYAVYINGIRVWTFNFQLQNTLSSPNVGVGVLCHEMFHSLGSPDLYHYNESSSDLQPVGQWDLMEWNTNPPQHMGAYMKYRYGGWLPAPTSISGDGSYSLQPLTSQTNNCYKIPSPNSQTEYFVVEYRKKSTSMFEENLPGSGMLVYRINTTREGNAEGPPDEVYIYRPGGSPTQDGTINSANFSADVGRTEINDATNPNSFLSNGSDGGLDIRNVGISGSTISFDLGEGGGPSSCSTTLGDANGDAAVNILDLVVTVNHILGTVPLDEAGQACADVNEDQSIDVLDLVATVNLILGKRQLASGLESTESAPPVLWSSVVSPSGLRLRFDSQDLAAVQFGLTSEVGHAWIGTPRITQARPETQLAWRETEEGWMVLAYNPTGSPLADGPFEIVWPVDGTAATVNAGYELVDAILASTSGSRLELLEDRSWYIDPVASGLSLSVRPSPTAGPTEILFQATEPTWARIAIHDASGRRIESLFEGELPVGRHVWSWRGVDAKGRVVSAGVYFVRCDLPGARQVRPVLVIR